jgi:excisionase family DNA binding protein
MSVEKLLAGPGSLATALEPYLTVKEVAAITRLSKAKVYALIEQGILPSVQPPGLVAPADLRAYLEAGRKSATPAASISTHTDTGADHE